MNLLEETKSLLKRYDVRPLRRIGQNFCVDPKLLESLVKYSRVNGDDIILEVGAGFGFLTELLSKSAKEVMAIEVDPKLVKALRDKFSAKDNVKIIEGDVLKTSLPPFDKVVANPPYSISSPLIMNILEKKFTSAVLTLQDEFCKRMTAKEGNQEYGSLSVVTNVKANIKCLEQIPRSSFYPQPEVKSRIVLIEPKERPPNLKDEKLFFSLTKSLFTERNKKLGNALQVYFLKKTSVDKAEVKKLFEDFPYLESRVRSLKPEEIVEIANRLYEISKSRKISVEGNSFYIFPEVYMPSDDTFLLAEQIKRETDCKRCLDIGTGCGILGILMAKKAQEIVAVDVNPHAVECTKLNSRMNALSEKIEVKYSNLFDSISGRFDLIVCNPPYLPCTEDTGEELAKAWDGGPSGRRMIDQFLRDAPRFLEKDGRILIIQSSLSNSEKTIRILEESHFKVEIIIKEKLDFEELVVIKAVYED
ncbi:MAG: rRNA (adenine1518-N6/adenine1519-N6)-dimethyltransferase [Thermoproteota archaeon]|nr:rRNA (adenine1518-N6/adenine1519-N6)-dimethyltransferase [Thermoproteota archaeon]